MKKLKISLLIAGFIVFLFTPLFAQDDEEAEEPAGPDTEMSVLMVKKTDGSRVTTIKLNAAYEDHNEAIANAPVNIRVEMDTAEIELGSATTAIDGTAEIIIPADMIIPKDAEGYFNFSINYDGDDSFDGASEKIRILDFILNLRAELVDSVKTIIIEAHGIGADGIEIPYHEEEVPLFVQGMISRLPLEAVWMEEGYGELEFPSDLPGSAQGNLSICAAVLEHSEYGNVEVVVDRQWGTGFEPANKVGRALWGSDAPWWMIIVLVILISGVWGHYVFAMLQLRKISRLGNKNTDS